MHYDLAFAWRTLRRSPAFALTAILTLGLAIGANTAVFSLIDSVLLRPLPYPEPDRIGILTRSVTLNGVTEVAPMTAHTGAVWEAVRDGATTVRAAAYAGNARVNLVVGDQARAVEQQRVGAGYFGVLGVSPAIGREFTPDEDVPGGPPVTILSERLWHALFEGDQEAVGRTILLRGEPHTVVGVMPEAFRSTTEAEVWTPLRPNRTGEGSGTNYLIAMRLRPGVDWPQARAELAAVADPELEFRETRQGGVVSHDVVPMHTAFASSLRGTLVTLWIAVGLVLVVATVNLAGLLLARAGQRTREIATRLAVGGGRGAILRQLLTESLLLAALGGALGLIIGATGLRALNALAGSLYYAPWAAAATLGGRAVGVTLALTLVTAVAFGLVPAWQASRIDVNVALAEGGTRGVAGGARGWPRRVLVTGQVALGVVLLVGAGLLARTYLYLDRTPAGFEADGLVTMSASLEDARYREVDAVVRLFDESIARLDALPGVEAVTVSLGLPYQRVLNLPFTFASGGAGEDVMVANATYVTPGYFETLRLPLRQGRAIAASDTGGGAPVAVVNEAFVRQFLRGRDPLATELRMASAVDVSDGVVRIVGVAADVPQEGGFMGYGPIDAMPMVYLPVSQVSPGLLRVHVWFSPAWIIRTAVPGVVTDVATREAMRAADPRLPVTALQDIDAVRAGVLSQQRFSMLLVGVLGLAALLLSALGLHGLIAGTVTERMREFGIRLALGTTVGAAIRTAALPGLRLTVVGLVVGSVAALGTTRLIGSQLWGVSQTDPVTYLTVAVLLLLVALVASVGPALRLRRLDPLVLLRE
jgi:predicted permease